MNLSVDEVEKILKFAKKLNPKNSKDPYSGRVTVTADESSGIGVLVKVSVPYEVEGFKGTFTTDVTDYAEW